MEETHTHNFLCLGNAVLLKWLARQMAFVSCGEALISSWVTGIKYYFFSAMNSFHSFEGLIMVSLSAQKGAGRIVRTIKISNGKRDTLDFHIWRQFNFQSRQASFYWLLSFGILICAWVRTDCHSQTASQKLYFEADIWGTKHSKMVPLLLGFHSVKSGISLAIWCLACSPKVKVEF